MEHYVDIRTLKRILTENYRNCHQKMSFDQVLSYAIRKGLCSTAAPSSYERTNRLLGRCEFIDMIDATLVEADFILNNPQKIIISEEYIIPEGKDVEAVCHLPFVDDRLHCHNHLEIDYVYSGSTQLQTEDDSYILKENELCIIPPEMRHNLTVEDEESIVIGLMVRQSTFDTIFGNVLAMDDLLARYFKNVLYNKNNRQSLRFHVSPEDELFSKLIQDIILEAHSPARYSGAIANCLTQEMFFLLLREYSSTAAYFRQDEFMADQSQFLMILEYTQKHYDTVSLEFLSGFFNYNESYLSRMFKEKMNMNFSELLMNIRMKKAADLLKNTRFSIAEISEMVGYTSVDYFTKAFKKNCQFTPSGYRKRSQPTSQVPV